MSCRFARRRGGSGGAVEGEGGAGGVGRGGFHGGVGGTDAAEGFADDGLGEGRAIAVAAEVAEVEVTQLGGHDFCGDLRGCVVGKVAVPAEDALLGGPGTAGVVLEHFHVVIRFEDEDVGGADAFDNEAGGVAEIGEEANIPGGRAQEEADGIVGIMRDAEGIDGDISELEGGAGGEEAEVEGRLELGLDDFLGQAVAVNGDVQPAGEHAEALGVVGMFVGDENSVQVFGRSPDTEESLTNLARAEAGINEQTGVVGLKIGAVPAGTAGEDGKARWHDGTLGIER